jgi:hypothetical protein
MKDPVLQTVEFAFSALAKRFGMRIEQSEASPPEFHLLYVNRTTGLEVVVDWAELRPFVWLHRLESGRSSTMQAPRLGEPLKRVDVDDILLRRDVSGNPAGKLLARADIESLAPRLAEYARAIELECADVLSGDFVVFEALQPVVEARIRHPHA